jgi:hypothetical protein
LTNSNTSSAVLTGASTSDGEAVEADEFDNENAFITLLDTDDCLLLRLFVLENIGVGIGVRAVNAGDEAAAKGKGAEGINDDDEDDEPAKRGEDAVNDDEVDEDG